MLVKGAKGKYIVDTTLLHVYTGSIQGRDLCLAALSSESPYACQLGHGVYTPLHFQYVEKLLVINNFMVVSIIHHSLERVTIASVGNGSTVRCRYNAINFLTNIHKRHPIARPFFVDPVSDWYSASVPMIIDVISHNIGPRYNGTPLYKVLEWN